MTVARHNPAFPDHLLIGGLHRVQHDQLEQDKARYLREPKAAAQLRHPNIVPVYEASLDRDKFFIVSAFIEGETPKELLERDRLE